MTMFWSFSPILGFFLAPLVGSLSDRCNSGWGRRRPFILLFTLLIFTGLMLVPWGKQIGIYLEGNESMKSTANQTALDHFSNPKMSAHFHKWTAIITTIGLIFLDFSADSCQTPARAYLLDICISGKFRCFNFQRIYKNSLNLNT